MKKLKSILISNDKNDKYIESLPKIYGIFCWRRYGVWELPFTGQFEDNMPLVYDFDDGNGCYEHYILRKLNEVTAGSYLSFTFDKFTAYRIADTFNKVEENK